MKDYLFVYDVKKKKIIMENHLPYTVKYNHIKQSRDDRSFTANASLGKNRFSAVADYWGINTHYYYFNNGLFIASSSLSLVLGQVKGIKLSKNDIFDLLFFGYPYAGRTIFESINRLKASEQLEFNFDLDFCQVEVTQADHFNGFFQVNRKKQDPERLKNILDNHFNDMEPGKTLIGLSAGSDTRTLLATLLHYNVPTSALSFGDDKSLELKNIEKLCQKNRITLNTVNSRMNPGKYIDTLNTYTRSANYLVTGQNVHVAHLFQNRLKEPARIFMGFLGSELVKGALSEAMISYPFQDLLQGKDAGEIVQRRFKHLTGTAQQELEEYISGSIISRVFPEPDRDVCLVNYCFNHLPANFFAGAILFGQSQGYSFVLPYLFREILNELYSIGLGLIHNNNFKGDFSWKKCFSFEALWTKLMSKRIYHSFIPQYGASLSGLRFLPKKVCSARTALHHAIGKYYYKRPFFGQIDRTHLEEVKRKHIVSNYETSIISTLLNLDYADRLERINMDNLNYIILCEQAGEKLEIKNESSARGVQ